MHQLRSQAATGLLSRATDEDAFLAELAAAYTHCGIGSALAFDAVRRYWRDGVPAEDWRRALARETRYDGESHVWRSSSEPLATLLAGLLRGRSPTDWHGIGERLVLLLAPLLEPVHLRNLLMPRSEDGVPRTHLEGLHQAHAAALIAWADALARGDGDWAEVNALLREAGADLALLRRIVAAATPAQWAAGDDRVRATLRVLAQLRLTLLLLREHLRANAGAINPDWALMLLLETHRGTNLALGDTAGPIEGAGELVTGLLSPLARIAVDTPLLFEMAARERSGLGAAIVTPGLGAALAGDDARWARFLDALSDDQLRGLWLSAEFGQRFPAATLRYEQAKWKRCAQFRCGLRTDEARAWYTRLLPELSGDGEFSSAFGAVFSGADIAAQRALIATYLRPSRFGAPHDLLDQETDLPLLLDYVGSGKASLRDVALRRLFALAVPDDGDREDDAPVAPGEPREPYWSALRGLEAGHADALVEQTVDEYGLGNDRAERWESLWQHARQPASRSAIAKRCLRALDYASSRSAALALAESLYARAPGVFVDEAADSGFRAAAFNEAVATTLSPLRELVATASAAYLGQSSWFGGGNPPLPAAPVNAALAAFPQSFAALDEKRQSKLLPLLDGEAVIACGATLAALCATTGTVLRTLLIDLVARMPPDALKRSGLLDVAERKARLLVLTGLAQNRDAAAVDLIEATIADTAHDEFSRGLALDALSRAGRPVDALDPWHDATLASLQAAAAKAKIPAAAAKAWNEETARLLVPLGADLGRQLLAILLDADEMLPRRARQIFAFLTAAQRSDFAGYGVRTWIAENGADKFAWLLSPLADYGDERIANDLVRAVKAWMKTRKPKASAAIRMLARLPGSYGISQVRELWESRKFSESIQQNAKLALQEAAQRQGMSLAGFLEQLVPDFGLDRDGLRLDVGPYAYTARVRGDFSVVVVDADGKSTKTLPRARAGENAELRGIAENQLKSLAKNLKPVFKQQSQRLLRTLQTGRIWPVALWRRLFIEHPLLAVLSQSVVWSVVGADDASLARFRPSGSGGFVDAADDDVALADDARVRVAHPLEMPADEHRAWKAQFGDYELLSPFAQFDMPVVEAGPGELDASDVARAAGSTLNRAKFGGLVEKWGYLKGAGEDGAMINEHTWQPDADWHVTLLHSGISVFFTVEEDVTVDRFLPRRRGTDGRLEPVTLRALPPAFRATLLAQAEALKAAAM